MESPWNTFDRIVCFSCPKNADRKDELLRELDRVGILRDAGDRFSFHNNTFTAADARMRDALARDGVDVRKTPGAFKAALIHHEVIKCAEMDKCDSLLLLEDDIRFMKDLQMSFDIMSSWRDSACDLVLFDRFVHTGSVRPFTSASGRGFVGFDNKVRSAACYALTRNGITAAVQAFESGISGSGRSIYMADDVYDYMRVRKCYTAECPCIQKEFSTNLNLEIYNVHQYDVYARNGIDISKYSV